MRYTTFGRRTGLRVSEYALGTGNFGTGWGAGTERDEAKAIFDRFVDAGGNFIDTASNYQVGQAEKLVGEFIHADREDLVVATKFAFDASLEPKVSRTGNARKNLRRSVEDSLARLNTDYIDVLYVHYPDALTPIEELLRGMDDLVSQGKVLYPAFSNFPAWRVSRAALLAEVSGWAPVAGIQIEYSLVERTAEREILPMAEALGLGVALWSPLGGGLLTGKYRTSQEGRLTDWGRMVHTETGTRITATLDTVIEIADQVGRTPAQVATAWVRERARRLATPGIPIIGPRHVAQLDDYLDALTLELTDAQYDLLEEVSAVELGSPHEANAGELDALQGGLSGSFESPAIPVA